MIDTEERKLPGALAAIRLHYHHRSFLLDTPNDAVERWSISADLLDDETREVSHIGSIEIVSVDLYDVRRPLDLLDAEDGDLIMVGGEIFGAQGGITAALEEHLEEPIGSRILLLNRVQLASEWRGFGLGALLVGVALNKLSIDAVAAACYPAPLDLGKEDGERYEGAVLKLAATWGQLGFEHFRGGVHVLNLATTALSERIAELQASLPG